MQRKRIEVLMRGGLGNQLFGYAAGRELSARTGLPLHLVTRSYFTSALEKRAFELEDILPDRISHGSVSLVKNNWTESSLEFDESFRGLGKPVRLEGYFQSPRYFAAISGLLVEEIRASFKQTIRDDDCRENFIGVHLRRGDYLNLEVRKIHGIVPLEFFQEGIGALRKALGNLPARIFSDDLGEAQELASTLVDATVFDPERTRSSLETLAVLSKAAGFCLSNSTFGWWAAYLSDQSHVVVPKPWFQDESKRVPDLYLPSWTVLDYR